MVNPETYIGQHSNEAAINHPAHYGGDTPYEAIKVIEAWKLGFHLGNTVKYISRADHKGNTIEDLKKARWYLDREIRNREQSLQVTQEAAGGEAAPQSDVQLRDMFEMPKPGSIRKVLPKMGKGRR
jgi:hypothetical protein